MGHGYEDFDFMLRLFKYKNLIEFSQDIVVDEPYLAPLMSVGLRALLAKPFLQTLLSTHYFLHLFHSKDQAEDYYQKHHINQDIFMKKYHSCIENDKKLDKLDVLQTFFNYPAVQKNSPKYAVLWAELKGHQFR